MRYQYIDLSVLGWPSDQPVSQVSAIDIDEQDENSYNYILVKYTGPECERIIVILGLLSSCGHVVVIVVIVLHQHHQASLTRL